MTISRRKLILGATVTLLASPALAQTGAVRRNVSGLQMHHWKDHFDDLGFGRILCDTSARALSFWGADGETFRMFPSSVAVAPELLKTGYTEIIQKVAGPTWRPTPSMRERDPSLPAVVPAGPNNPLGTHALYLSWQYYRIHGTHDTRKIGRPSSDGCVGLYNEHIAELYTLVRVGTKVRII